MGHKARWLDKSTKLVKKQDVGIKHIQGHPTDVELLQQL
jgi:hypothetical protein